MMSGDLTPVGLALGGALISKELVLKLLGPTAEYFGQGARDLAEKSVQNIARIISVACGRLHDRLDGPGRVNPRVFKQVWDEGRFVEDVLAAEYFGGLLAGARTEDGADDSMLPHLTVVTSLSTRQLRLHFLIYAAALRPKQTPELLESGRFWDCVDVFIPEDECIDDAFSVVDQDERPLINALVGLKHAGLLGDFGVQIARAVRAHGSLKAPDNGIIAVPTRAGAELFARVLGFSSMDPELLTNANYEARLSAAVRESVKIPMYARCTRFRKLIRSTTEYDELDEHIDEVESSVDDVKSDVDEIREALEKLKKPKRKEDRKPSQPGSAAT